jgi:predicted flap endonuclease-1-like 5' DNA nuclease
LPDDLRLILGIGKTNEKKLHEAGVTTFAQIAAWKPADVKTYSDLINFGERIVKEQWVEQARLLAKGDMDAFFKAFPAAKGEGNT